MGLALCNAKWSIRLVVTSTVGKVTCAKCGKMIADAYNDDMKLDKGVGRD